MHKIILGIGNPGNQYEQTYHNLGKLCVDYLLSKWQILDSTSKRNCDVYTFKDCHIVKSKVYMNISAEALEGCGLRYSAENLVVLHDDLMINQYDAKLKHGGGCAGHNGLRSIADLVGKEFTRVRLGIGYHDTLPVHHYVLSKIENLDEYAKTFEKARKILTALLNEPMMKIDQFMPKYK